MTKKFEKLVDGLDRYIEAFEVSQGKPPPAIHVTPEGARLIESEAAGNGRIKLGSDGKLESYRGITVIEESG